MCAHYHDTNFVRYFSIYKVGSINDVNVIMCAINKLTKQCEGVQQKFLKLVYKLRMRAYYYNHNYTAICYIIKGTTSPAERCDLGSVKLEKFHEFFQVYINLCQRNCDNMWLVMAGYEIKVSRRQICTESSI